jgi:transposase
MIEGMKAPHFTRPFSEDERHQILAGLRSSDAFVLRRCQILLASDRGERAGAIAKQVGCHKQTVLTVIHSFNADGLAVLEEGSSRPHRLRTTFSEEALERLQDLLHRSPRDFDKPTSLWTLELAALVSFEQGLTPSLVSDESVRRALKRLGTNWKRAKHWITSPDPHYLRKKTPVIGCSLTPVHSQLGRLAFSMKSGGVVLPDHACMPGKARRLLFAWSSNAGKRAIPTPKPWPALASCGKRAHPRIRIARRSGYASSAGDR